jgi:dUTP pyrophosphatase
MSATAYSGVISEKSYSFIEPEKPMSVKFFLASPLARVPTKGSPGSAGYDVYSSNDVPITIPPGARALIPTGLITQFSSDVYGRIADRSGVAYKMGGHVLAGVIDSDYRSTIGVVLHNTNSARTDEEIQQKTIVVNPGDRIAQIIFEVRRDVVFVQVDSKEELDDTSRGTGGFGSTGMK